jgi:hypothetical protein
MKRTLPYRLLPLAAAALLGLASPASADWQRARTPASFAEAVTTCTSAVRRDTDARYGYGASYFDAYFNAYGGVRVWGTAPEYWAFEKCLNRFGYPYVINWQ